MSNKPTLGVRTQSLKQERPKELPKRTDIVLRETWGSDFAYIFIIFIGVEVASWLIDRYVSDEIYSVVATTFWLAVGLATISTLVRVIYFTLSREHRHRRVKF